MNTLDLLISNCEYVFEMNMKLITIKSLWKAICNLYEQIRVFAIHNSSNLLEEDIYYDSQDKRFNCFLTTRKNPAVMPSKEIAKNVYEMVTVLNTILALHEYMGEDLKSMLEKYPERENSDQYESSARMIYDDFHTHDLAVQACNNMFDMLLDDIETLKKSIGYDNISTNVRVVLDYNKCFGLLRSIAIQSTRLLSNTIDMSIIIEKRKDELANHISSDDESSQDIFRNTLYSQMKLIRISSDHYKCALESLFRSLMNDMHFEFLGLPMNNITWKILDILKHIWNDHIIHCDGIISKYLEKEKLACDLGI